jgi:hypothetical protein
MTSRKRIPLWVGLVAIPVLLVVPLVMLVTMAAAAAADLLETLIEAIGRRGK